MKTLKSLLRNLAGDQRGQALVMVAAAMVALVGFTALVTDIGLIVANRQRLVNTMDAAALAGAQELPDNPAQAIQAARDYAGKNNYDPTKLTISVSGDNSTISVSGDKDVSMTFAKVLGISSKTVSASSTASVQGLTSCTGVVPFTISSNELVGIKPGDSRTFVYSSHVLGPGNYGLLALNGRGAPVVYYNIVNGCPVPIYCNQPQDTEPGKKKGKVRDGIMERIKGHELCTLENHEANCPKIIIIPVFDPETSDFQGRGTATIIGFSAFFLDNYDDDQISGRFIKTVGEGDASPAQKNYGVSAVRLIN